MVTRRSRLALLMVLPLALMAACGDDGAQDSADSDTTASTTTSTTEATDTAAPGGDAWTRNAVEHRGKDGERVEVDCTPDGRIGTVWGTNTYTDDSSICSAAVHVGLVTVEDGGSVTIEIAAGEQEYFGSESNGVTSQDFGPYAGSFTFPDADEIEVAATIGWDRAANFYANRDETEFTVECEPGGTIGSVWGTDVYTADSSICTAALHAGLVSIDDGGEVTFELVDGQDEYRGSTANGVTTSEYGAYDSSFRFVDEG